MNESRIKIKDGRDKMEGKEIVHSPNPVRSSEEIIMTTIKFVTSGKFL